jgi:hypothetical protein
MRFGLIALITVAMFAAAACGGSASETPPPLEPEPPPTNQPSAATSATPYVVQKGAPAGDAGPEKDGGALPKPMF